MSGRKRCPKCGDEKNSNDFCRDRNRNDGRYPYCKQCVNRYNGERKEDKRQYDKLYLSNPDNRERQRAMSRAGHIRRYFNITVDQFNALIDEQSGGCAICGCAPEGVQSLSVDHDHECCPGKKSCGRCIRGLLCGPCNRVLGMMKDDPRLLQAAIDYLEGSRVG